MTERTITGTPEDYQLLWLQNPLALAQLKAIILERLLNETEASLATTNGALPEEVIVTRE